MKFRSISTFKATKPQDQTQTLKFLKKQDLRTGRNGNGNKMTQHFLGLLFLQLDKVEVVVLFWSNVIFWSPDFHNKQQRFRITIIINSQTFKKTSRMNENNRGNVTPRRILYFWQGTWASPYLVIFEFSTSSSVKFWIAALKSQNHDDWLK